MKRYENKSQWIVRPSSPVDMFTRTSMHVAFHVLSHNLTITLALDDFA